MQENERIATGAISCVPKGRKRACGANAADRIIRQPATQQGRVTVDGEDHATQVAQTVAIGVAAPCQAAQTLKEEQGISPKLCASDRQSGSISLEPDERAKSVNSKPLIRYRICPPPESHNFVRNQLRISLKQVENKIQLNDDCNATVDSKEHRTRTKKTTILSAIRRRRKQNRIYSQYKLMKTRRPQNSRTLSYCFA